MEDGKQSPSEPVGTPHVSLALMAMAALLVYLFFGQRTFYREDGYQLIYQHLSKGSLQHDIHPLYLPSVWLFEKIFAFTGFGIYRLAVFFSGFATALGVYVVGRRSEATRVALRSRKARRAGPSRNRRYWRDCGSRC